MPRLEVREVRLANGLTVLAIPDHRAPVVSVQVWYRVGSRDETPGRTGLAHLFEHLMFKGSRNVPPERHARLVQAHGGNLNAFTTHDATAYYENVSSEHLELCLRLEADRMQRLEVNDEKLIAEREVVKEERRLRSDSTPQGRMVEEVFALAYRSHPYRNPVIGWMEDLDALTAADCRAFYRAHYAPNRACLVVAGDADPENVHKLARRHFGSLRRSPEVAVRRTPEPAQTGERRAIVRVVAQLPQVIAAWHVPAAGHADLFALDLLAQVLSHGESSRLHRRLVYRRRLALNASADVYDAADPGLFFGSVDLQEAKDAAEGERAFRDEITRALEDGVTQAELETAKRQTTAQLVFQFGSAHARGRLAGRSQTLLGDWRKANRLLPSYQRVTRQDVVGAARRHLTDDNLSVVTLIPTPTANGRKSP